MILPGDAPLEPLPPEAREWLIAELSRAEYEQARPTLVDLIAQRLAEWLGGLFTASGDAAPFVAVLVGAVLAAAVVVAAVLVGGPPRRGRRTRPGALFGDDERRSAAALRRDARLAAARGEWSAATADAYRALAAGLIERELVASRPGTTAVAFARRAGEVLPEADAELRRAADAFDGVRYLGRVGTPDGYEAIAALDARLEATRPVFAEASG